MGKPNSESSTQHRVIDVGYWIHQELYYTEYIGVLSKPGELKYLSSRRKGHQLRLPQ